MWTPSAQIARGVSQHRLGAAAVVSCSGRPARSCLLFIWRRGRDSFRKRNGGAASGSRVDHHLDASSTSRAGQKSSLVGMLANTCIESTGRLGVSLAHRSPGSGLRLGDGSGLRCVGAIGQSALEVPRPAFETKRRISDVMWTDVAALRSNPPLPASHGTRGRRGRAGVLGSGRCRWQFRRSACRPSIPRIRNG
jgi:hypothetical protein